MFYGQHDQQVAIRVVQLDSWEGKHPIWTLEQTICSIHVTITWESGYSLVMMG